MKKCLSEHSRAVSLLRAIAVVAVWMLASAGNPGQAQSAPAVQGDYVGTLAGALGLKLHITAAPDGALSGTLDQIGVNATSTELALMSIARTLATCDAM